MEYAAILLILAACFGLFMAWGIGTNDVANAMATSVGSRALTLKQAIIIAAIFEFSGAFLAGGEVTATIRKGILDASSLTTTPEVLVYGMLAALLAAGIWLLIASHHGLPVSTTHSIVGAIIGFAATGVSMEIVRWEKVGHILMSWVLSPLLAGIIAYYLYRSVQFLILGREDPLRNARRYVPVYIFITGAVICLLTLMRGLKHIGLDLDSTSSFFISMGVGGLCCVTGIGLIRRIDLSRLYKPDYHFEHVEKIFGVLMIFTACAMAFAHGSNDVANAIGPVAAVFSIISSGGVVSQESPLSPWILLLGAGGIVPGLLTYGRKVIATVGRNITELTPSRGFCCELSAATTVVLASSAGLPISTTHTLVGAVLGIGLARGLSALNLGMIGTIFMSWIVTLPAGAILAAIFFRGFTWIFV